MPEEPLPRDELLPQDEQQENTCKKCGSLAIEPGYMLPLCSACRTELARRPIPARMKVFFVLIAAVLFFALLSFPKSLTAAIHLERGARAEASKHYLTALREYQAAAKTYGGSTAILTRLFVTYYRNWKVQEAIATLQKIAGRKVSESVATEIGGLAGRIGKLFANVDDLDRLLTKYKQDKSAAFITELREYVAKKPTDVLWASYLASQLYEREEYDEAERVMVAAMKENGDYDPGHILLAGVHREQGDFASAVACCDNALRHNAENASAFAALARIELKRKRDKEGLALAEKAYALDPDEAFGLSALALAYHYNGRLAERDKFLYQYRQHKDRDEYSLTMLTSIFSGEKVWR